MSIWDDISSGFDGLVGAGKQYATQGGLFGGLREAIGDPVERIYASNPELRALGASMPNQEVFERDLVVAKAKARDPHLFRENYDSNADYVNALSGGQGNASGGLLAPTGASQGTTGAESNTGTFKPYTATTGSTQVTYGPEGVTSELTGPAGTYKDTALGQASAFGTQLEGLLGADTSQRAGEISQAQLDLMAPQLQALRHQMGTNLYGSGREGLNVAASGLGFEGGLVNPERLERNIAESEAARQATAFGQTQAQSELNQQIANMMGAQQGMFGQFGTLAGLEQSAMNPALAGLVANQNWQQYQDMLPLNQAMMQANIDKANYQPDPLMSGLLGLGTSFLGTSAGGNWLSNLL